AGKSLSRLTACLSRATQPVADLLKREVGLHRQQIEQPLLIRLERRLYPVPGFAATLPVLSLRSSQGAAVEGARWRIRATSRRLSPSSTIKTARSRKSFK